MRELEIIEHKKKKKLQASWMYNRGDVMQWNQIEIKKNKNELEKEQRRTNEEKDRNR